jgi:NAD(P)-dependent dehydrogenase (short-subunit alcohol dehydrogenase family)
MTSVEQLDFAGRVAIVTGASAGMGREHATMLASRGARVVVSGRSAERVQESVDIIEEAGGTAVGDLSDIVREPGRLVDRALDAFGRLDIVVNNAGIPGRGAFREVEASDWWNVFDTHVRATVDIARHALPHLVSSGSGRLINISSSAMLGVPNATSYSAAKAAIWGFGNSLAAEVIDSGVQVSTVQPSAWTRMTETAFENPAVRQVLRDQLPASAVAAFVTWLAHQDTKAYGQGFQVSGVSAGITTFAAAPRIRVAEATPEHWAQTADALTAGGGDLTALRSTNESFRAELVFLDPAMDGKLPAAAAGLAPSSFTPPPALR